MKVSEKVSSIEFQCLCAMCLLLKVKSGLEIILCYCLVNNNDNSNNNNILSCT